MQDVMADSGMRTPGCTAAVNPLLHSSSCGQKIQVNGLADKQSTAQAGPPEQMCLPLMGHTGKRNKEDCCAQSQGCRSGWGRTVCGQVPVWL